MIFDWFNRIKKKTLSPHTCKDCQNVGVFKMCTACEPPDDKVCNGCFQNHLLTAHNICEGYLDEL
jgi:hypothetical protein